MGHVLENNFLIPKVFLIDYNKDIPVYIPCNTLETYRNAAFWDEFTNFIEDCSLLADEYCTTDDSTVSCYPNPAIDYLKIEGVNPAEVHLFNKLGQLMRTVKSSYEIDLCDLPKGIYTLRVLSNNGNYVSFKVVKE